MSLNKATDRSGEGKGWRLSVTVLPSRFAVCKLDALAPAPEWGLRFVVTLVFPQGGTPAKAPDGKTASGK